MTAITSITVILKQLPPANVNNSHLNSAFTVIDFYHFLSLKCKLYNIL